MGKEEGKNEKGDQEEEGVVLVERKRKWIEVRVNELVVIKAMDVVLWCRLFTCNASVVWACEEEEEDGLALVLVIVLLSEPCDALFAASSRASCSCTHASSDA